MSKHIGGEKPFLCECGDRFSALTSLNNHRRNGHSRIKKCSICNLEFKSKIELISHRQEIHEIGIKCPVCSRIFSQRLPYINHLKIAHKEEEYTIFTCEVCAKEFENK